jgi:integrase
MEKIKRKDGMRYRERIYIGGQEYKSPCFERKADALAWRSVKLAERRHFNATGIMPNMKPILQEMRFHEFAKWWLDNRVAPRATKRTYERYADNLKHHVYPLVGDHWLSQITREHADNLVMKLREAKHNPVGTNLVVGVLKQVMSEAFRQEKISKYPFSDYGKLKEPKRADHYMSREEIEKFLVANKNDPNYWLFVIAMNTGMRRGELAGLCWDRVDFGTGFIHITRLRDRDGLADRTKTRNSQRRIPMSDVVKQALTEIKARGLHPEFVFCHSYGKPFDEQHIYWYFQRAQKKAGLTNHYRFHDLRHTFASHFVMNGGSLYDLQKLLGHARFEETQRYAHLTPEHLAKAINIVSFGGTPSPTPAAQPPPAAQTAAPKVAAAPALRLVSQT